MSVSSENKALAKYLKTILGGTFSVTKYWDEAERASVDVVAVEDVPEAGLSTYSTLGLSDYSISLEVNGIQLGVELLLAQRKRYECAPNVLSTCAFNIINSGAKCKPGVIYPGVVEMYKARGDMKHVLFVPPFLWKLETQCFPAKAVAWLLAVPVSDPEAAYAKDHGSEALEELLERHQIDMFNLDRTSAL